jgi:hypothetical protein
MRDDESEAASERTPYLGFDWGPGPALPRLHVVGADGCWTISPDPVREGWETDSNSPVYGLPRWVAEALANAANARVVTIDPSQQLTDEEVARYARQTADLCDTLRAYHQRVRACISNLGAGMVLRLPPEAEEKDWQAYFTIWQEGFFRCQRMLLEMLDREW